MIDQRNRHRMKQALVDPFGPPRADLPQVLVGPITRDRDRRHPRRVVALACAALLVAVTLAIVLARGVPWPLAQNVVAPQQNPVVQQLRQRPLKLPSLSADGSCPLSSPVTKDVFFQAGEHGSGWPVYGDPGPVYIQPQATLLSSAGYFGRMTYVVDARYHGLALVRGRKLNGVARVLFAGPLASGNLKAVVTIAGTSTRTYDELVLPAGNPGDRAWRQWDVIQGFPGPGCYGWQIDTPSSEYSVVVSILPGG